MPEPCPFCGKPIVREYGSFRCKHCAGSSEDLIDMERKARAAEVRKQTRVVKGAAAVMAPPAPEVAVPEPPRAPRPVKVSAGSRSAGSGPAAKLKPEGPEAPPLAAGATPAKASSAKPAARTKSAPTTEPLPAPRSTKSARLRMVSAAAARIAERKKATPTDDAPPPAPAKKSPRKAR